jgi:hypothetical protein
MTLFLDGFENDETKLKLMESPAFPLVREIAYKHGLRVIRNTLNGWLMGNQYGLSLIHISEPTRQP